MSGLVPVVIGTAGHVDHGKTSLVRRLTGVDTDRLVEEQRRGLTIDLGFAAFALPSGRVAGVIDVPGHERFLKNMLAGVGGMDLVLLVVAADDGVMPQTREHLAILELLGVAPGLIVMTKVDVAGPDLVELAEADIREGLTGTSWVDAPVHPVSSVTGEGLDALVAAIDARTASPSVRPAEAPVRLAVDRAFVRQGFGTVVTGTLTAGTLREGMALVLEPGGYKARVRGLQVHGASVGDVVAGHRVAVNLALTGNPGVDRGHWLLAPETLAPSDVLDVRLATSGHEVRHGQRVRIHHGTREVLGRIALAAGEVLPEGSGCLAQLLLEQPLWADFDDRLVLRHYDPGYVVAGATVLAPGGHRLRRRDRSGWARMAAAAEGRWADRVASALAERGWEPLSPAEAAAMVPSRAREDLVASLVSAGRWLPVASGGLDPDRVRVLGERVETLWRDLPAHRRLLRREEIQACVPARAGILGELLARLPSWTSVGRCLVPGEGPRTASAWVAEAWTIIHEVASAHHGLLDRGEVLRDRPSAWQDLLDEAIVLGEWLDLGQEILVRPADWEAWCVRVRAAMPGEAGVSTASIRETLGLSRRYVVPLLEAMDARGHTRRQGELRLWLA
ncbi:MAG: selenocysteine-specific translation elongation factor [Candidatus Sericytochromatia bacterium]|nr:selenocysteine-specific translation elongation factor [Candidatus Tanganyikabacteria bacterium]